MAIAVIESFVDENFFDNKMPFYMNLKENKFIIYFCLHNSQYSIYASANLIQESLNYSHFELNLIMTELHFLRNTSIIIVIN